MPSSALADDQGAAVIEFVMMIVLLVLVLFGVLQVAVYCYARNIVAAAAADGARYAASLGVDPGAGRGPGHRPDRRRTERRGRRAHPVHRAARRRSAPPACR